MLKSEQQYIMIRVPIILLENFPTWDAESKIRFLSFECHYDLITVLPKGVTCLEASTYD